jgi:hypothetical protein
VHGDKAAYEMLENVKAHCERKVHELELQLKNKHDVLVERKPPVVQATRSRSSFPGQKAVCSRRWRRSW